MLCGGGVIMGAVWCSGGGVIMGASMFYHLSVGSPFSMLAFKPQGLMNLSVNVFLFQTSED